MRTILLIDAHSLIHRCYHALPPLTNKDNEPTGALYGLANILLKITNVIRPDYAVALFDRPEPTFRKERYDAYKAHRPKADDDLVSQLIRSRKLFEAFSITTVEKPGYEADDLIGTLATRFKKEADARIVIFTGDLDSLQLVDDGKVVVETFKKGISETVIYDEQGVFEKLGVRPDQVIDYKALVGDASDNIPGVAGIGPKTASAILSSYDTLQNFLLKGAEEKAYEKIKLNEKNALLSQELAQIDCNVPVNTTISDIVFSPTPTKIRTFFEENNFDSLLKRLEVAPQKTVREQPAHHASTKEDDTDTLVLNETSDSTKIQLQSEKLKIGYNLKQYLKKHPLAQPYFDILIALHLLEIREKTWEEASGRIFKTILPKKEFLSRAYQWTQKQLAQKKLDRVFSQIEMPLIPVLARMEQEGILIDEASLKEAQKEMAKEIVLLEKNILKKINKNINLNSPKQLLEYFKSCGAKITSTAAQVLDRISASYPITSDILLYREFFKLKTTYIDAFEKLVAKDGRIHPTFLQLGATTGRLSCQNPNLQNIPQESSWSKQIRNIFIAPPRFTLVAFDYSQIELRVLASLSKDPTLTSAFAQNKDIHRLTAQRIFGLREDEVAHHQRRIAKTLNFGIIYGMGPRAFAQQSGLSLQEAKMFIEKYFNEFSTVKEWQQNILKEARENEEVRNINGRVRSVKNIHSLNQRFSSESERIAINMPLQSLAADILKIAMRHVSDLIEKQGWKKNVRMILTIHDELVFEISDELLAQKKESEVIQEIKKTMENAYALSVPLKVDVQMAKRWGEME